jgi:CHAD domain-containing protein
MPHDGATSANGSSSVGLAEPRDATLPRLGPHEPTAHAIQSALIQGVERLRQFAPGARQGDVEGVHRMRTTARRLRSELRLYRDLLAGDWGQRLSGELQEQGRLLGAVRDADVLRARLRKSAAELVEDLGPLFAMLDRRHEAASAVLKSALESGRFDGLSDQLAEAAEHPDLDDAAWEPCQKVLTPLVRAVWKRLRKAASALDLSDPDEEFHEVRKKAKRARYCAESVAPTLDEADANDACRFARRATAVQDVLGEHQDAIIAGQEIRRIVAAHPDQGPFNLAAGRLLERQMNAAGTARTQFFKAWNQLDRRKNVRWMKG